MPSYKNELTEQIIFKALERRPEVKSQAYVQVEALYETLCQMMKENGSRSGFRPQKHFDRDIFDQILQQSELFKSGNSLVVKVQSFVINSMRAEIILNEKLKSIHKHIENLGGQQNSVKQKGRPANRFDPLFEQAQSLSRQLQEIKNQKIMTEEDLFSLRLTFIQEDQLKTLTKRLQMSKSNPLFKPLQLQQPQKVSQQINTSNSRPSYHFIGPNKNSPSKKMSNQKPNDILFTAIFLLTSILLIIQSAIAIFYKVSFLNLFMLVFIELMFLKQKYSNVELKFFMVINAFSLVIDLALLFVNKHHFWPKESTTFFQGHTHWRSLVLGLIVISLFGKILLEVFLIVQNLRTLPQQITLNLICFSFSLKQIQRPLHEDIIHTTFVKVFS